MIFTSRTPKRWAGGKSHIHVDSLEIQKKWSFFRYKISIKKNWWLGPPDYYYLDMWSLSKIKKIEHTHKRILVGIIYLIMKFQHKINTDLLIFSLLKWNINGKIFIQILHYWIYSNKYILFVSVLLNQVLDSNFKIWFSDKPPFIIFIICIPDLNMFLLSWF